MARHWGSAIRLGGLLLGATAVAANSINLSGVWVLDSARSGPGQCWKGQSMMLRVEHVADRVIAVELVNDESGGRILKREFTALGRVGNTIQLRAEQQHNQSSAPSEKWVLSNDCTRLSIHRPCGPSLQELVFQQSTKNTD